MYDNDQLAATTGVRDRRSRSRSRRQIAALIACLAALLCSNAWGQNFTGTFLGNTDTGQVTVELSMSGEDLVGSLSAQGVEFALEGFVQDGVGAGYAYTAEGSVGFEAYLEGDTLGLYLFEMDSSGAPIVESVIELIMTRQTVGASSGAPATDVGQPSTAGTPTKQNGLPTPPPTAASPTAPSTSAPTQSTDQVLVAGTYATLTYDNAVAFIEALEFVLAQVGYAYTFTEADRAEALAAIATAYPGMAQMDQVVLSQSRDIFERVKVNWPSASPADQEQFALGVLILAFGEQTVSAWVGSSGGGGSQGLGGSSSCTTFEDCTSGFVDEQTWTDTFNAQGCWAAAGCGGYDPSTSTFDYESY